MQDLLIYFGVDQSGDQPYHSSSHAANMTKKHTHSQIYGTALLCFYFCIVLFEKYAYTSDVKTNCCSVSQQNNAVYNCKIWAPVTYGLVKRNGAHLRLLTASVPASPLPVFYDTRRCAHMTESAQRLEHCTGKSNTPQYVGPSSLNQLQAPGFHSITSHIWKCGTFSPYVI